MKTNRSYTVFLTLLLAQVCVGWAGGVGDSELKKHVVIDEAQAAALTNEVERLLHGIRLPKVDFKQAAIDDIICCFNAGIQEYGQAGEAKRITVALDPDTRKELMKREVWEGGGGIVGVYTFSGLELSVLEAVQLLQEVADLGRKVEGSTLILSGKKDK